jgi:hypothetical protein
MRPLSARDLLLVWEQGERERPPERALALLAAACPELSADEIAALPVGGCESRLFALYRETFGEALELTALCPACREPLEIAVSLADLAPTSAISANWDQELPAPLPDLEAEAGLRLRLRPPTAGDLAAAGRAPDLEAARRLLAERAVLAAFRGGVPVAPADLTPEEIDRVSDHLAENDPQAESLLELVCPSCSHRFEALLDAAECLWREVEGAARRLLREVHALARGYGWREADILAMSSRRRRRYVEMLAG